MKLFYLPPKKFAEAVIIAVILSFSVSMIMLPHQVETPIVEITPVPTPEPVYIKPTPEAEPTVDIEMVTFDEMFDEFESIGYPFVPMLFALFILTTLVLCGDVSRVFAIAMSFGLLGISVLMGVVYPWYILALILIPLSFVFFKAVLNERDVCFI
jgi:hypothetical protein